MTTTGAVRKNRFRIALFVGLALSSGWFAYWLQRSPTEPDFLLNAHPTSVVVFHDLTRDIRPDLPYFEDGSFHSPDGSPLRPKDVIRDERSPDNIDSPGFMALFRLKPGTSQSDFVEASKAIWAVCDAGIAIASNDREEAPTLWPATPGKDCARLFPKDS